MGQMEWHSVLSKFCLSGKRMKINGNGFILIAEIDQAVQIANLDRLILLFRWVAMQKHNSQEWTKAPIKLMVISLSDSPARYDNIQEVLSLSLSNSGGYFRSATIFVGKDRTGFNPAGIAGMRNCLQPQGGEHVSGSSD